MKKLALAASIATLVTLMAPAITQADTAVSTSAPGETDAGALINKKVVDANNDTVGTIDSVLVSSTGKVDAVVLDVSSWLESKKLISVAWNDLKVDAKGKIQTSLTKEAARQAAGYAYKDQSYRGQILTDTNGVYQPSMATSTKADGQTDTSTKSTESGLKNADGTVNASEVIGLKVRNTQNEDLGKISEVLLNGNGRANGVIVDVGGVLGVGAHPVRVAWKEIQLHENGSDKYATVPMSKDQLKQLPAAKQ